MRHYIPAQNLYEVDLRKDHLSYRGSALFCCIATNWACPHRPTTATRYPRSPIVTRKGSLRCSLAEPRDESDINATPSSEREASPSVGLSIPQVMV